MDVGFRKVEERLERILFLTFDSFLGLVKPKQKCNQWSESGILVGKGEKEREREQCKWPQKKREPCM